jgi:hypothetical protein
LLVHARATLYFADAEQEPVQSTITSVTAMDSGPFCFSAELWKATNQENLYVIDSFPMPVCDNIRIARARIYQDESFRGYIASKKRYFYGLKVHLTPNVRLKS